MKRIFEPPNDFLNSNGNSDAVIPFDHDIVVLPLEVRSDIGIYCADVAELPKELRAVQVDAVFLHDANHRNWRNLKGEMPIDLIIGIAEGVVAAAAWAAIVAAFRSVFSAPRQIRSRLIRQSKNAMGELENTMFEYQGTTEGFIEALAHLDERLPSGPDSND